MKDRSSLIKACAAIALVASVIFLPYIGSVADNHTGHTTGGEIVQFTTYREITGYAPFYNLPGDVAKGRLFLEWVVIGALTLIALRLK